MYSVAKDSLHYLPVPSMVTSWSLRFASTFWMPSRLYNEPWMSLTQLSQVIGTAKRVYRLVSRYSRDQGI